MTEDATRTPTEAELRAALRRVIVLDVSPGDFLPSEDPDWQVLNDAITDLAALRAFRDAIDAVPHVSAEAVRAAAIEAATAGGLLVPRPPLPRLVTGPAPMDPRAAIVAVPSDDDLAREAARDRLWTAALAYGAARESRLAERDRLRAANYQGDTAEGAAYSALLVAEADALDALHAAYADYAVWADGGGA